MNSKNNNQTNSIYDSIINGLSSEKAVILSAGRKSVKTENKERKEEYKESHSRPERIAKFVFKNVFLLLFIVLFILMAYVIGSLAVPENNIIINAKAYDVLTRGATDPSTQGIFHFVGGIVSDIVNAVIALIIGLIVGPSISVVNGIFIMVQYLICGGLLNTFIGLLFGTKGNSSLGNTFLFIIFASLIVFFICIVIAAFKISSSPDVNMSGLVVNIAKSGLSLFMIVLITLFLFFFVNWVASWILRAAIGSDGELIKMGDLVLGASTDPETLAAYLHDHPAPVDPIKIYNDPAAGLIASNINIYGPFTSNNTIIEVVGSTDYSSADINGNGYLDTQEELTKAYEIYSPLFQSWENGLVDNFSGVGTSGIFNPILFLITIVMTGIAGLIISWNLFIRAFQIIGLLMISPYPAAVTPFDGGEKFSTWRKTYIDKWMILILFSILFALYVTLVLNMSLFTEDFNHWLAQNGGNSVGWIANSLLEAFILIGGAFAVIMLPATFSGIVGSLSALMGVSMARKMFRTPINVGRNIKNKAARKMANFNEQRKINKAEREKKREKLGVKYSRIEQAKIRGKSMLQSAENDWFKGQRWLKHGEPEPLNPSRARTEASMYRMLDFNAKIDKSKLAREKIQKDAASNIKVAADKKLSKIEKDLGISKRDGKMATLQEQINSNNLEIEARNSKYKNSSKVKKLENENKATQIKIDKLDSKNEMAKRNKKYRKVSSIKNKVDETEDKKKK